MRRYDRNTDAGLLSERKRKEMDSTTLGAFGKESPLSIAAMKGNRIPLLQTHRSLSYYPLGYTTSALPQSIGFKKSSGKMAV
jgi:hypothetical protein